MRSRLPIHADSSRFSLPRFHSLRHVHGLALVCAMLLSGAMALFAAPGIAHAQPRVEAEALEDLELFRKLERKGTSAMLEVGTWGGMQAVRGGDGSDDGATLGRADVFLGTTLGAVASQTTRAIVDSFVQLPVTFGEQTEVDTPTGTHMADVRLGLITKDSDGRRYGFEAFATVNVDHGGDYFGVRPALLGAGDYVHTALSTGFIPRFQFIEDAPLAFIFPISYELMNATFLPDDALSEGMTSHGVEAGTGFEVRVRGVRQGRIHLIQVRHEQVELDTRTDRGPSELERTVVEGLEYEGAVFEVDDLLFNIQVGIGGGFIRDSQGREADSVLGRIGMVFDFNSWGVGAGYKRDVTWSGTGERLLGDNRLDLTAHMTPEFFGVGFRTDVAVSLLDDLMVSEDDAVARLAANAQLFMEPFDDAELGLFYNVDGGKLATAENWDPRTVNDSWHHEAGVFLRWRGTD